MATGWLAAKGITPSLADARLGRVLLGAVLAAGLCGLVGVGVAALVRNQVAALVGVAVWVLLVEGLLMSLLTCPQPGQVAALGGRGRPHQPRRRPALPVGRDPAAGRLRAGLGAGRDPPGRPPRHHLTAIVPGAAQTAAPGRHPFRGRTSVMASLRTWRTAFAALLLVALATTGTSAAAGSTPPPASRAHYCKQVDAYRHQDLRQGPPASSPLGRQLRWVLAQLAGEAATLTEAEVRAHFSAEFFAVWGEERSRRRWSRPSGRPSPSTGPSTSSASPTRPGPTRRWR